MALEREAFAEAVTFFSRSLELAEKISSAFYAILARSGLGNAFLGLNRPHQAAAHYLQALETTAEIRYVPHVLSRRQAVSTGR